MSGWESSLKNLISLRTFLEHEKNKSQAHNPRNAVCGACVLSIAAADSEEFSRLVSGAEFLVILMWRGWSNDWLSHWSWEPEMWMTHWATPAAACETSDFVQISCSRQPLPRLLHCPVFQAVSVFLVKTRTFSWLLSFPPSLFTCLLSTSQLSPLLPFLLFLNCLPRLSLFLLVYFFESFFV